MRAIHEAAEWNQRLKAGDLDDAQRREYRQWMQAPLHQTEMGRMCLIDALLQHAPLSDEPAFRPDNVIDFQSYAPITRPRVNERREPERERRFGSRLAAGAVAASVAICLVIVGKTMHPVAQHETIVTTTGAWDKKLTDDGSVLYAGPESELTYRQDDKQRTVTFTRGEAYFDVAPDPTQPFVVSTDFGTIRVLGTEFLAAYDGDCVAVTVREGKVGIAPRGADAMQPTRTLVANQQVLMCSADVSEPVVVDAEREVKWVRNWYEPQGETVCEIVGQLNRRLEVQIVVEDRQFCRMRINSLSFRPSAPEDFVAKVNRIYAEYPHRNESAGGVALRLRPRRADPAQAFP